MTEQTAEQLDEQPDTTEKKFARLVELMTRRRYSFRAIEAMTGLVFDPMIWTADRFATFSGIDVFAICTNCVYPEMEIGERISVHHSIYRLEFTRTK